MTAFLARLPFRVLHIDIRLLNGFLYLISQQFDLILNLDCFGWQLRIFSLVWISWLFQVHLDGLWRWGYWYWLTLISSVLLFVKGQADFLVFRNHLLFLIFWHPFLLNLVTCQWHWHQFCMRYLDMSCMQWLLFLRLSQMLFFIRMCIFRWWNLHHDLMLLWFLNDWWTVLLHIFYRLHNLFVLLMRLFLMCLLGLVRLGLLNQNMNDLWFWSLILLDYFSGLVFFLPVLRLIEVGWQLLLDLWLQWTNLVGVAQMGQIHSRLQWSKALRFCFDCLVVSIGSLCLVLLSGLFNFVLRFLNLNRIGCTCLSSETELLFLEWELTDPSCLIFCCSCWTATACSFSSPICDIRWEIIFTVYGVFEAIRKIQIHVDRIRWG